MENQGFSKQWISSDYNDFYWLDSNGRFQVTYLKPDNVLKTGPNPEDYIVIDANIKLYDRTPGIEFNYRDTIGLTNEEIDRQYADYNLLDESQQETDDMRMGNYQSEFNTDEVTYDDGSSYNSRNVFSDEEWDTLYEQLVERSPLMAKQAE